MGFAEPQVVKPNEPTLFLFVSDEKSLNKEVRI